jgi:hypothetical protein
MPEIDLTETLLDVVVAGEPFIVVRRPDVVGQNGVNTIGSIKFPAVGQITPTGDNSIVRAEAYSTRAAAIRVTTTFMLRGPSKDVTNQNFQPDIVIWKGGSFEVATLDDFSQYGAGMVTVECVAIDYVPNAPSASTVLLIP